MNWQQAKDLAALPKTYPTQPGLTQARVAPRRHMRARGARSSAEDVMETFSQERQSKAVRIAEVSSATSGA